MRNYFLILFLLIDFFYVNSVFAQISEAEQSAFLDSILNLNSKLNSEDDIQTTLNILNKQIFFKEDFTKRLKYRIVQLDKEIYNYQVRYESLNAQLDYEKGRYADMVVLANRMKLSMRQNFDIFSLDNLYKSYRQFLYIKRLTDYRLKKIKRINELKSEIERVVVSLDDVKKTKNDLAKRIGVEESWIKQYNKDISQILDKHSDALDHNNSVALQSEVSTSLNNPNLIDKYSVVDTSSKLTNLFQVQKGYLIWPVKKSTIISKFGEHQHPVYNKVTIRNDGVDFCVPSVCDVRAVYNGIISKVVNLPQKKFAIIVRHGNFFTIYSGLDHINVSKGDEVDKEDCIGKFDGTSSNSLLNFQIWYGIDKLNPEDWLVKSPK